MCAHTKMTVNAFVLLRIFAEGIHRVRQIQKKINSLFRFAMFFPRLCLCVCVCNIVSLLPFVCLPHNLNELRDIRYCNCSCYSRPLLFPFVWVAKLLVLCCAV